MEEISRLNKKQKMIHYYRLLVVYEVGICTRFILLLLSFSTSVVSFDSIQFNWLQ